MAIIKNILAHEILDSRGNPTVSCDIWLDDNSHSTGYVPSGVSAGKNEAVELRDGDNSRYNGKGVLKAVNNINTTIKNALIGSDASNLMTVDKILIDLDGTETKSNLGANAILAVSTAVAKASAKSHKIMLWEYLAKLMGKDTSKVTLPIPLLNILNGGKHAVGSTDFQEFMIVPVKFDNFKEAMRAGTEIFHQLGKILTERNYQPLVGDEGGYAPSLFSNEQAMELLLMAISEANYTAGEDIFIALDPAASRFYNEEGYYELYRENKSMMSNQLIDFYTKWCEKYPIVLIEDPLSGEDWNGWQEITQRLGNKVEIIGDDIYSTNKNILKKGIESKSSTGILIKPNQIGTLSETLETIKMANDAGFKVVVSHRSGETEDILIADLAIATGCGVIKSGSPCRSERTAKYNRIIEIEDKFKDSSMYAKWDTTSNSGFGDV